MESQSGKRNEGHHQWGIGNGSTLGSLRVWHCWELSGRWTKAERQDTELWKHHTVGWRRWERRQSWRDNEGGKCSTNPLLRDHLLLPPSPHIGLPLFKWAHLYSQGTGPDDIAAWAQRLRTQATPMPGSLLLCPNPVPSLASSHTLLGSQSCCVLF